MTRVLLLGASGQLGTAIAQRWSDCEIVAPLHDELAIEQSALLVAYFQSPHPRLRARGRQGSNLACLG